MKKKQRRDYSVLLSTIVFMLGGPAAMAEGTAKNQQEPTTVMDVGGSQQDREIASKIRQELVANKNLSTKATNVQILTKNGSVVLKGEVASRAEKTEVERLARVVAGANAVKSEVTVAQ